MIFYVFTSQVIVGFKRIIDYANHMENISKIAEHRLKMLNLWEKHGWQSILDIFEIERRMGEVKRYRLTLMRIHVMPLP